MKTSARNQLAGTIAAVVPGPVSTDVTVTLTGGQEVAVTVTTASAQGAHGLGLAVGKSALVLIKASAVILVTDFAGYVLSARNQLRGTVSAIERGAVSSIVHVTLPSGPVLTASLTNEGADELALKVGAQATACFKAYSPLLAVAAS
jgi:molybdate transport system regulatory protein